MNYRSRDLGVTMALQHIVTLTLPFLQLQECLGVHWSPAPPDGGVVYGCVGQSLSLPWHVITDAGERIVDIRWFYDDGSGPQLVALMDGEGHFLAQGNFAQKVSHGQDAELTLSHVSQWDKGTYSVTVYVHMPTGELSTLSRTVQVKTVTEPPQVTGGALSVHQEPGAVYDVTTGDFHIVLTCGTVLHRGQPPVDVQWMTPSGSILNSTSEAQGVYQLVLPNPAAGGRYTCRIPPDSPAASCVTSSITESSLVLDETQVRLTLLESRLQRENQNLKDQNTQLMALNNNLTDRIHSLELTRDADKLLMTQQISDLTRAVDDMKHKMNETAGRHISFHARLLTGVHLVHGQPIILGKVLTNQGGAYDGTTGFFTAPVNGTYFFIGTDAPYDTQGRYASMYLMVDDTIVSYVYTKYDSFYEMGSCHAVVHLHKGQRAWLKSNGEGYFHYLSTAFSGFLVSAD